MDYDADHRGSEGGANIPKGQRRDHQKVDKRSLLLWEEGCLGKTRSCNCLDKEDNNVEQPC